MVLSQARFAAPIIVDRANVVEVTEREQRLSAQRAANAAARERGEPLPFPNPWDELDPTKVAADASPDEVRRSYEAFQRICRPPPPIRHVL